MKKKTIPEKIGALHKIVYDRMFDQQVDVFINYTPEQFERWLNREKIADVNPKSPQNFAAWTGDYEDEKGVVRSILFINDFNWAIKCQGSLIHEITHVIIKIWARNNIPFNADTQEFLASSIGRMYEDIAHKLLK